MATTGTATIDFGAAPGTNLVTLFVADAAVLGTSHVEAFMMGDTTVSGEAGHNEIEHAIIPIKLTCSATTGVGFTITAYSELRLTSTFKVRWVWV